MAKGQQRGNRETRKPKAVKAPPSIAAPVISGKEMRPPIALPKKKG